MQFAYDDYVKGCLILPACITLLTIGWLVSPLARGIAEIKRNGFSAKVVKRLAAVLLICAVFLSLNIGRLLYGGICLVAEREEDAVEISGTISSIENLSRFSFPELNNEYRSVQPNGAKIVVGDVPCVAVSSGEFAVGDFVTVVYLPQSRYVLSIEKGTTQ